ncbi:MAG: T9SS type B sorting domain-containing protein, partial [Sphingobacteriales bacterium]
TYNNGLNKIFMGGGGGSGHVDNIGGSPMRGGNGGGIVIINTPIIKANNYKIIANGANAPQCTLSTYSDCHDASGGGGGGGVVVIKSNNFSTTALVEAKAGKGGDVIVYNPSIGADKIGPGGGGGGGIIWLSNPSLPANVVTNVSAGANGVISIDGNNPWGATAGTPGTVLFNLALPLSSTVFSPNIDSVRIKDSATSCNSFAFKGLAFVRAAAITQWQWSFGDASTANTQNTTYTYSLPGTYTVKLVVTDLNGCKDSVSIPVTSSGASNDFGYKQDVCSPLSIEFTSSGTAPTSTYWSFGDGNTTTGNSNPTHTYATTGNYLVKYVYENGACKDSISKTISINVVPDNIILTPDTTICFSSTKQLFSAPSLKFCWSPSTYLNDPLLANPVTSTPVPITYYLTAEVAGTNVITNGNFSAGNTGFTSDYAFAANNTTEGEYFVGTSPQAWNTALSNCTDHTTGNGNMLLVNGSPTPNVKVWTQTVTVTPNTNYAFSSWVQALYPPNPAQLGFSINGSDIGTLLTASLPTCTWSQFYTTWNSGNSTSAIISIVNKNSLVQGNDFALDDISFAPVFIKRDSVKITVDTPLVRTIADTAACLNSSTTLTTTGATAYSWSPATGLSATNIANPIATPASTTQYIVTGTNGFGCVAKDTVTVTVKPLPVIVKSANDTICNLQSIQLNVSGGASYSWFPGGTLSNASIPNPVATPNGSTTYTVTVTAANACINTDSIKISIDTVVVNTIADASACLNTSTVLTTTGAAQYSWFPAAGLSAANIANPVATPATSTQYVVTGTSAAGCTGTDTVNITVKPLPVITASLDDSVCLNASIQLNASGGVSYSWFPAQTLSNASIANPIATPVANTMYYVTATGANNCTNKDSVNISVKPLPVVSKSANDTICSTQSAQLSASGGISYSWTPASTLNNANIANPIAMPSATTTYTVIVTGSNNCLATDSVKISLRPSPNFTVSPAYSTCVNGTAPLIAGGGTSYLWSPAQFLNNAGIANPVATVSSNTTFTVLIRDSICNVSASLTTNVTIDLVTPGITASKSSDIDCVFRTVQLNATGATGYVWSPATGLSSTSIRNPIATPTVSQQYTVVGTNSVNNCKSKDTITVFVKAPAAPKSYIPNTFTPNADGSNDCFRVRDFGTVKTVDIMIFNRYGNLVFQTRNLNDCWDGRYKGQPAEVGNYVYYITVLNDCGKEIKKGNLLLIR